MSMTDPIADFITRIRNALLAKHDLLDVPASKVKVELCRILKEQGFIESFRSIEGTPSSTLRVFLRYSEDGTPAISHVQRVSKPGRRVYRRSSDIQPIRNGLGVGIVSTSKGLLTDRQAREQRVGGEVLCEIW